MKTSLFHSRPRGAHTGRCLSLPGAQTVKVWGVTAQRGLVLMPPLSVPLQQECPTVQVLLFSMQIPEGRGPWQGRGEPQALHGTGGVAGCAPALLHLPGLGSPTCSRGLPSSPPSCSLQPQGFTTPCFALEQDSVPRTEPGEAKELPQALPIAHTPHCHRVGDPSPKIHFNPGPCWEHPAHPSPSPAAFSISVTAPWTLLPLRAHTSLWQPMEGGGRGWFPIFSDVIKPQSTADRNPQSSTGNCQIPPR